MGEIRELKEKLLSQKLRYVKAKVAAEQINIAAQKARLRQYALVTDNNSVDRNNHILSANENATSLEQTKWSKWHQETNGKISTMSPELKRILESLGIPASRLLVPENLVPLIMRLSVRLYKTEQALAESLESSMKVPDVVNTTAPLSTLSPTDEESILLDRERKWRRKEDTQEALLSPVKTSDDYLKDISNKPSEVGQEPDTRILSPASTVRKQIQEKLQKQLLLQKSSRTI